MIVLAFMVGVSAIGSSFFRIHRKILPLAMLTTGFAIIIIGHIFITGWIEGIVVPLGGFTIAAAHFFNYKYTGNCKTGDHVSHKHFLIHDRHQ